MNSSVGVKYITVKDNIISGFSVGISINGDDTAASYVKDCYVTNNTILNAKGADAGHGYGIHLANARNCLILGNTIENSDRHSIYHAYGDGNLIIGNTIKNHRINHATPSELAPRSAIEVLRKSTNLTIMGNIISNCYNVGILVYAFPPSHETTDPNKYFRYGCIENITIRGNIFTISSISGDLGGLTSIMIGYIYDASVQYSEFANYYVNDVEIKENIFKKLGTEALGCIRIDQCLAPSIFDNTFKFYTPSSGHTKTLIEIRERFKNDEEMDLKLYDNTFNAILPTNNYMLYCIGNLASVNNSSFDISVSDNTLSNQYNGANPNYKLYQPIGITSSAGSNLHLQAET
jgi:parallel beta-helix repeat protein